MKLLFHLKTMERVPLVRIGGKNMPLPDNDTLVGGGATGPQGLSAYQIAVAEGFVGDETAWLASLHGADGLPGLPGTTTWAGITDKPSTFPPVIGSGSADAVAGNDPRLTDARTPTAHSHDYAPTNHNHDASYAPIAHNHDATYEPKNANIQSHVASPHAPSNAQANADITKAEIEAKLTGQISSHTHAGGAANSWDGAISAAIGSGNPELALLNMLHSPVNATPTNITATVARIAYFKLPANLTVNKIRGYGVGATTNIYRCAIYNGDTLARLTAELPIVTAAQAWFAVGNNLNLTLVAGQLYFIAVSVNAVGTTAGIQCLSGTTGRIGVLPKSWPGSLDADSAFVKPWSFAQFAVSAGALPATAPTIALQGAWAGGMPALFLDSNNA